MRWWISPPTIGEVRDTFTRLLVGNAVLALPDILRWIGYLSILMVLILTLILGPFMILLLFGLGFHNDPQALRTLVVAPKGSGLADQVKSYATSLGPQLVFMGVTDDKEQALQQLANREIDVVAVVPPDAYDSIRKSEQVVVVLYYYEVDPVLIQYMDVFGRVYVHEINRRVLQNLIQQEQSRAATLHDTLKQVRQSATNLRQALAGTVVYCAGEISGSGRAV